MKQTSLERYEEIKLQIKALEAEAKELEPAISSVLNKLKEGQIRTDRGLFYLTSRISYKYSKKVEKKAEELKELKHKEEESGVAKSTEKQSLSYRVNKN